MPESSGAVRDDGLLALYCNDHLAAAAGGIALVERMISTHRGGSWEQRLQALRAELVEERAGLRAMMGSLGLPVQRYRQAVVWVVEKLTRVKTNGRIRSRSPLSTVVEFEFLSGAVLLKRAGFETLLGLAADDARLARAMLDELIRQADRQHRWLAEARREVAADALGGRAESADDSSAT